MYQTLLERLDFQTHKISFSWVHGRQYLMHFKNRITFDGIIAFDNRVEIDKVMTWNKRHPTLINSS